MKLRLSTALSLKNIIEEALTEAASHVRDSNIQVLSSVLGARPVYYDAAAELERWRKLLELQTELLIAIRVASAGNCEAIVKKQMVEKEAAFLQLIPTAEGKSNAKKDRFGDEEVTAEVITHVASIKLPGITKDRAELLQVKKPALQSEMNVFNHETEIEVEFERSAIPLVGEPLDEAAADTSD